MAADIAFALGALYLLDKLGAVLMIALFYTKDIVLSALAAAAGIVLLFALNIVLGVLSPTIHALRLHFVECFGKFVEPGGRTFTPLAKK